MSRAHRLAAIMFTDIQGYTKLMQEDEDRAIEIRQRHRQVFQSTTSKNDGEIIQYYGDGTLSIFESCVDAVRCAKEMQSEFQSDPVIPVRIGIHLGDIVLSDEEIIGDSVNVASRVESLGIAGSVMISNKVYEEIRNKSEFETHHLGKFHFKNDKAPRDIYALHGEKLVVPKKNELKGKLKPGTKTSTAKRLIQISGTLIFLLLILWGTGLNEILFAKPINSLAVLPLYDRIGLGEDESYIIEGLHEEIITKLAKVGLNVKPYSTMLRYRKEPKPPDEMGKELNVDGLVEGSLFRSDDTYRIRGQIIEVANQEYFADPFEAEAEFASILSIYTELVEAITTQIEHSISDEARTYLSQNNTVDPEAYDLYLRGRFHLNKGSQQDILNAIEYFKQSEAQDPEFGDVHVAFIESYLLLGFASTNPSEELDQFRYHLAKAIEKDPFIAKDHHLLAMDRVFDNWDWKGAVEELEKAIKDAPKAWEPQDSYCQLMWAIGDIEKSIEAGEKAVKLDPNAHFAHCDLAWAYYMNDQREMAEKELQIAVELEPTCPHHNGLSIMMDMDSKLEIGQSLLTTIDRLEREIDSTGNPIYNLSMLGYAYALDGNREKAYEILEVIDSLNISGGDKIYVALGDYDKAFELIEESLANRSFFLMYSIKMGMWYDPLRDDPRFDQILTRMGLSDRQVESY